MKIKLTKEEATRVLYEDCEDYDLISNDIVGNGRWTVNHKIIIQRKSDGKYFSGKYKIGATENQDERPWEYETPEFIEVQKVEKTVWVYEPVE